MASPEEIEAIQKANILVVGAGGIGCELLKTLALTGFRDIHVIDLDTIEVSNLNRQFLFRKRHIGSSKAKVAREAVLKFKPDINIVAYHSNVKNTEFDVDFFKQFNVVLNGLDNLDARRHVNRLCLAANVPLVESGTMGYLGQVTVHIKGRTECYECQPKPAPKTYPVCTINSTPSKPVHCIVWVKELLFTRLFGDRSQSNDLVMQSKDTDSVDTTITTGTSEEDSSTVFEIKDGESLEAYSRRIFDGVFGHNIEAALKNEAAWKTRAPPTPLYVRDILPNAESLEAMQRNKADNLSEASSVSVLGILGLKNPQETWTLKENARVFLESLKHFLGSRKKEIGNLVFDKDDQLAVEFVTAAANLRAASFGIPMLSLFEAKGIAGNIVHAIATTNATISGLIVLEAIKVLTNNIDQCRMTYCLEHPSKKLLLMPVEPFEMNARCYVCSETPLYLEVDSLRTKLRDVVEKIVKKKLSVNSPIIMHGSNLLYETGDDLEENMVTQYNANLDKVLASLPTPIVNGSILNIEDFQQEFSCSLHIKHRETFDEEKEPDKMILSGDVASAVGKETISNVSTTNDKKGKEEANGDGQEGEEEDVVMMIEAPDRKRKLIDDDSYEGTSSGKRVRIDIS